MSHRSDSLKLGKGSAFDKSRLKRLRQENETWEADFRALPKPSTQTQTHYLGMVVQKRGGVLLADTQVEGRDGIHRDQVLPAQPGPLVQVFLLKKEATIEGRVEDGREARRSRMQDALGLCSDTDG